MTVSVSNTNLNDSFNSWRLNTNFAATVISNNVVTVARAGSANRGGVAKGNGHIAGTFTANELRTTTLKSGNTSDNGGWLYVNSNTSINATSLTVTANTTFQGNVVFLTSGTDRVVLGDISRVRVTGGTRGQFLRIEGSTDTPNFKSLSLRDIADLSTNSAHIILSSANTTFSDNGDSPQLKFAGINDTISVYLAADVVGDSDLHVTLADTAGDSTFAVTDSSNTVVGYIDSAGNIVAKTAFLPTVDDTVDLGASGAEFKDAYIDGVAYIDELSMGTSAGQGVSTSLIPKTDAAGNLGSTTRKWGTVWADTTNGGAGVFNTVGISSTLTVNGTATFNGGSNFNGAVDIGNATTDTVTFTAQVDSDFDPQTGSQRDMGSTNNRWHNVYANNVLANNITTDNNLTVLGDLSVSGSTTIASGQVLSVDSGVFSTLGVLGQFTANGNVDLGNATTDSITVTGQFDSSLIPITDDTYDLGTATKQWQDIWIDGTASIDVLSVDETSTFAGNATFNGDRVTVSGNGFFSDSIDVADSIDVTNSITNDGTVMLGKNGKLHANNTITNGTIRDVMLENSGVTAGTYGSASAVPQVTVDAKGLVTSISTATVAGVTNIDYTQSNNVISVATATGTTYKAPIDAATTTSGTGRGLASFDSGDFSVSSGHVTLKDATTGAVLAISGTAKEVDVSRTNGTVTVGLPNDVKITDDLFVGGGIIVTGNLVVQGTTTTVNSETVNIADNKIVINSNYTGSTPTEDAGIVVERGTKANYEFIWDESEKSWSTSGRNLIANNFVGNVTGAVTGNASTATKLATGRTIGMTGDVVWTSASFDGSGNVTGIATIQPNSVALGTDTTGNYMVGVSEGALIDVTHTPGEGSTATIAVDLSELTDMTATMVGTDEFVVLDASAQRRKAANEIGLSIFNNDANFSTTTGTVTSVGITAGSGIDVSGSPVTSSGNITVSIESDLRGDAWVIGPNSSDYLNIDGTANAHRFYLDGTEDMRLSNNGQLDVEGSVVAHSAGISDKNLKENIEQVTDAISKVQQLNGYTFNYKKDGRAGAGIIAQEVEEVLPSAVQRTEILGYEGQHLVVEYDQLTALLIESIKELKAEIDELKKHK